ncbi:hypothetical protein ACH5RR_014734 [Cinchona calisaya]|uniref:Uncharacterized protein n=1 Tax=Cinchona calisaya TaxID=153742 RepID=A0ABD2ZR39_9GENT
MGTMKKLYRKGTVHPSPPSSKSDHLSFLPATILTLTLALSPEDKQILAYLISSSSNFSSSGGSNRSRSNTNNDHPTSFNCYCFRCYKSYWVRWDSSPNRQMIHEIIDAFEDELSVQNKKVKSSKKERRKSKGSVVGELKRSTELLASSSNREFTESESSVEDSVDGGEEEEEELGKGSVRRFVSFLGDKIWGVWT